MGWRTGGPGAQSPEESPFPPADGKQQEEVEEKEGEGRKKRLVSVLAGRKSAGNGCGGVGDQRPVRFRPSLGCPQCVSLGSRRVQALQHTSHLRMCAHLCLNGRFGSYVPLKGRLVVKKNTHIFRDRQFLYPRVNGSVFDKVFLQIPCVCSHLCCKPKICVIA